MKKLALAALALTAAASIYAQGTVQFNNHFTGGFSYVWYNPTVHTPLQGSDVNDSVVGTINYTNLGYTKISTLGFTAAYLAANGSAQPESSLTFGTSPTTTTFRTGSAAGILATGTATLSQVPPDSLAATLQLFAWDNSSGQYSNPQTAYNAWRAGTLIGGVSLPFTLANIGGTSNTPPSPVGLTSFSVFSVPEPTTMALAGLGAAAMVIFRRRK